MLDGLHRAGTRWITLGGGEPLLREDIGAIIDRAKSLGLGVFISTNGSLVPTRMEEIRGADRVTLSLEGSSEVHDRLRGKGAFEETEAATRLSLERGLSVSLQCTLARYNLDSLEEVLDFASFHGIQAMFQPATENLDSSTDPNPIAPPVQPYRKTMARLIELKKSGAPIANSLAGLRHLARWPTPTKIRCSAGRFTCVVEPDGLVLACHQAQVHRLAEGRGDAGAIAEQLHGLEVPRGCVRCWCAPLVELDLIFSLRPDAILNALRAQGGADMSRSW